MQHGQNKSLVVSNSCACYMHAHIFECCSLWLVVGLGLSFVVEIVGDSYRLQFISSAGSNGCGLFECLRICDLVSRLSNVMLHKVPTRQADSSSIIKIALSVVIVLLSILPVLYKLHLWYQN